MNYVTASNVASSTNGQYSVSAQMNMQQTHPLNSQEQGRQDGKVQYVVLVAYSPPKETYFCKTRRSEASRRRRKIYDDGSMG